MNLLESLCQRSTDYPTQPAIIFLDAAGKEQTVATCADLYADTRRAAWAWRQQGVQPGDVVLVAQDHSYDLVTSFLGALYAGAVPAILPYPRPATVEAYLVQLDILTKHTDAAVIFAAPHVVERLRSPTTSLHCPVRGFEVARAAAPPIDFSMHVRADDAPLYLQLTSGTTGAPKMAVLSHRAVMSNIRRVFEARYRAGGPVVGCMPFNHDGGLVLCLLIPLVMGQLSVHLRPADWIVSPDLLWHAVTVYRGALTFLPNFALNFMVRRVPQKRPAGYQLDSLHTVVVAAELTTQASLHAFHTQFEPFGLRQTALCGAYGMAEQVVGVSLSKPGRPTCIDWVAHERLRREGIAAPVSAGDVAARAVVGCGRPIAGMQVKIADGEGHHLPDRTVGEILLRSDHCFSGYFQRPDITAHVLHDGWYCTGDLGYLAEGELFVLGRKDDLIIVDGQKLQPQTIEEIATAVLGHEGRLAVAFGLRDEVLGTETPVLVCETRRNAPAEQRARWQAEILRRVNETLNVTLPDIRFVPKGWIVQSDAKIGRAANREKFLAADFQPEPPDLRALRMAGTNRHLVQHALTTYYARLLAQATVPPDANLFALGLDSMSFVRALTAIEVATGRKLTVEQAAASPSIAGLSALCCASGEPGQAAPASPRSREQVRANQPFFIALRRRLARQAIAVGPLVGHRPEAYDAGPLNSSHALPYALGLRLQRAWLSQPGIQDRLFARHLEHVRAWQHILRTDEDPRSVAERHLLANLWFIWRARALSAPQAFAGWVTVVGAERLRRMLDASDKGIVLLSIHSPLNRLFRYVPLFSRRDFAHIDAGVGPTPSARASASHPARVADRAIQVAHAQEVLARRGVVMILGDGTTGAGGIDVNLYGRSHPFRFGAAELAVETGALLVPAFTDMQRDGRVTLEVLAPLATGAHSHAAQVAELTARYAAAYVARWPRQFVSMGTGSLRDALRLPQAIRE